MRGLHEDRRGVSQTVGFVLSLATLTIFAAISVPVAANMFTESAEYNAVQQMELEGQRVALAIEEVDRLARESSSSGPIGQTISLSERAAGRAYEINITPTSGGGIITVVSDDGDLSTQAEFRSQTPINETEVNAGRLRIVRERGTNEIRIEEVE